MSMTYSNLTSKQAQRVAAQYLKKPQSNRQKLINAFAAININTFVDIERIKKPQKHALWTGRMLCLLISILRDKPVNDDFSSWDSVQNFVTGNLNKFTNEVLALQKKLLEHPPVDKAERLLHLYNEHFASQRIQTFKNHIANKNLRAIAQFVHAVLCFTLNRDEEHFNEDISSINQDKSQFEFSTKGAHDEITPKSFRMDKRTTGGANTTDQSPLQT